MNKLVEIKSLRPLLVEQLTAALEEFKLVEEVLVDA
jgi:hypothetical protein